MSDIRPPRLLIVDDDQSIRFFLNEVFRNEEYDVRFAADGNEALKLTETETFDIALVDFRMPGMNGLELMTRLKKKIQHLIVIIITAYGSKRLVKEAMERGAYDFFTKPIDIDDLRFIIRRAIDRHLLVSENRTLKNSLASPPLFPEIIGDPRSMQGLVKTLAKVVNTDVDVLITGESGTGKELVAKIIHRYGKRAAGPMVEVNCAAIPDTLLEAELFGHERGAFTGAEKKKIGRFERAHHGTIFLDEISEMNVITQGKLLRVIQEREIERLGGTGTISLDFRLIAASNRDLLSDVQEERFREDLYYRLNVVPIHVPPLRERKNDIMILARHFLETYCRKYNKPMKRFPPETVDILEGYDFPGNVRQLENLIQQAVVLADGPVLKPENFSLPETGRKSKLLVDSSLTSGDTMEEVIDKVERQLILQTLRETNWRQQETANRLKISRKSLYNKIKKFNIVME